MTTLLTIYTPLFIGIIGALVGIIAFLLWVLRVVLRQNEGKDYDSVDMLQFAQSVTNLEISGHDLSEWKKNKAISLTFSDN